ncbi:MAG TPA: glycosyltransferase family 4 protein [Anaerolineae bacterium]|nr:glycosyltransferase family 4 protein [Anaerolineae bacterium]
MKTHLVVYFTRGVSLQIWDEVGMFEREVALYRRLQHRGVQVHFVTYGDAADLRYAERIQGMGIVCNRWGLPERWYARLISHLYPLVWRGSAVFKSNQIQGADVAMQAARRCGKRFIARCGYLYSEFMEREHGSDSAQANQARALEQRVLASADRVVVTTRAMQDAVVQRYQVPLDRIVVIPNYVDTDLFHPNPDVGGRSRRICFVGRLDEQKNPLALLEAIKDLDVELVIVGNGPLRGRLREEANLHGLAVRFLGNVPHRQLPEILNSAALFILPSHYEGHPKTLLEAMACGRPVIGTDVPGIRQLIQHRETGYLCGTSPEEIRTAIRYVLGNTGLRPHMGRNAREFVVQHFALDRVLELELAVLAQLVP